MKFVRFDAGQGAAAGVLSGESISRLEAPDGRAVDDVIYWLNQVDRAAELTTQASTQVLRTDEVRFLAPVPRPRKFLAIGMNYQGHLAEMQRAGMSVSSSGQVWFNKQVTTVNGPFDDVLKPATSDMLDYEVELCMVVARYGRDVPRDDAASIIGGFMVCNDFSVRDWQIASPTLTLGKSFDTHGPVGPYIVTPDEVGDPHELALRLWVNGELRQDSSTGDMIHDCWDQVAHLTRAVTLEPGDLIATGTPAGVGALMTPRTFLKAGDVVRAEVERVGHIQNTIVDRPRGESDDQ